MDSILLPCILGNILSFIFVWFNLLLEMIGYINLDSMWSLIPLKTLGLDNDMACHPMFGGNDWEGIYDIRKILRHIASQLEGMH